MKGSYVLVAEVKENSKIRIGKLGEIDFKKGYYCYVGSALGKSTNLENRTRRYRKLNKEKSGNIHWHIDYFLVNPNVEIVQINKINSVQKIECKISRMFEKVSEDSVHGFGCSDCKCKSHLYYFNDNIYGKVLDNIDDRICQEV